MPAIVMRSERSRPTSSSVCGIDGTAGLTSSSRSGRERVVCGTMTEDAACCTASWTNDMAPGVASWLSSSEPSDGSRNTHSSSACSNATRCSPRIPCRHHTTHARPSGPRPWRGRRGRFKVDAPTGPSCSRAWPRAPAPRRCRAGPSARPSTRSCRGRSCAGERERAREALQPTDGKGKILADSLALGRPEQQRRVAEKRGGRRLGERQAAQRGGQQAGELHRVVCGAAAVKWRGLLQHRLGRLALGFARRFWIWAGRGRPRGNPLPAG